MMKKVAIFAVLSVITACALVFAVINENVAPVTGPAPPPVTSKDGPLRQGIACPAIELNPPPARLFQNAAEVLNLTDDQKIRLAEVMDKSEQRAKPLMDKLRAASDKLRPAALADRFDQKALEAMVKEAEEAEQELIASEISTWAEIRNVLTTEQVKTMRVILTARPGR